MASGKGNKMTIGRILKGAERFHVNLVEDRFRSRFENWLDSSPYRDKPFHPKANWAVIIAFTGLDIILMAILLMFG